MRASDLEFARRAQAHGWISADALDSVLAEVDRLQALGLEKGVDDVLLERRLVSARRVRALREELGWAMRSPRLGDYALVRRIGVGGSGVVFEARHVRLGQRVALKVLLPRLAAVADLRERFLREGRALAKLSHPHLVHAIDAGADGDRCYLALEFVEGENAQQLVARGGPVEPWRTVRLVTAVAQALEVLEAHGLLHCDIKPANVILEPGGGVRLVDLGLATALAGGTEQTALYGSPHYLAPERITRAGRLDSRSDIYSLAATWFYLLAGRPPFSGTATRAILEAHVHAPVPSVRANAPEVPERMARTVERWLAKDPAMRPENCSAALHELRVLERSRPAAAPLPAAGDSSPVAVARRPFRGGWLLVALAALLAGGFLLVAFVARTPQPNSRPGDAGEPRSAEHRTAAAGAPAPPEGGAPLREGREPARAEGPAGEIAAVPPDSGRRTAGAAVSSGAPPREEGGRGPRGGEAEDSRAAEDRERASAPAGAGEGASGGGARKPGGEDEMLPDGPGAREAAAAQAASPLSPPPGPAVPPPGAAEPTLLAAGRAAPSGGGDAQAEAASAAPGGAPGHPLAGSFRAAEVRIDPAGERPWRTELSYRFEDPRELEDFRLADRWEAGAGSLRQQSARDARLDTVAWFEPPLVVTLELGRPAACVVGIGALRVAPGQGDDGLAWLAVDEPAGPERDLPLASGTVRVEFSAEGVRVVTTSDESAFAVEVPRNGRFMLQLAPGGELRSLGLAGRLQPDWAAERTRRLEDLRGTSDRPAENRDR